MPSTLAQDLLSGVAVLIGLLAAAALLRRSLSRSGPIALLGSLLAALVVLAVWIGGELLLGHGIKLKAALTFVAGLLLMALAAVTRNR